MLDAVLAESEQQRLSIWKIREDLPECTRQGGPTVNTDTSVPVSAVPKFLNKAVGEVEQRLAIFRHQAAFKQRLQYEGLRRGNFH